MSRMLLSLGLGWLALAPLVVAQQPSTTAPTQPASPPQTIELRNGQYWEPVSNPTTAPVTDEILERAGQFVANNNNSAAKKLLVNWLKRNKESPLRDRALFLLGTANFQYGDRINSFYNFDELLDNFPDSKYFYAALEKQYAIADAFLNGYRRRLAGI